MKKLVKTLSILGLAALGTAAVASCGEKNDATDGESFDKVKITVGVSQDTGTTFQAMSNWLNSAKDVMNFEWDYVVLDRTNSKNVTAFQNKLSTGTNAIISMADFEQNNLALTLRDLETNDAYLAGYETEFANATTSGQISNSRIVGTVTDGEGGPSRGETLFNQVVKTTNRKIVFAQYKSQFFPSVKGAVAKFMELAEEYNQTHDDKFTFFQDSASAKYDEDGHSLVCNFGENLSDAIHSDWQNANVDAVVAVNSVAKLMLTTLQKGNIKLFSVGFDDETGKELGNGTLMSLSQTPAEVIFVPVLEVLNALRGKSYSDKTSKIATAHYVYLNSQDDLTQAKAKIMNFSDNHDIEHALITPQVASTMLAQNSGTTYKAITDLLDSWVASNIFNK